MVAEHEGSTLLIPKHTIGHDTQIYLPHSSCISSSLHPPKFQYPKLPVRGHAVVQLRYKPEGGGFDSQWCHCNFSLT